MTASELRQQWNDNDALRSEWHAIVHGEAWRAVSEMVEAEAIEDAEFHERMEADPVLARNLHRQIGARRALRKLADAANKPPEPIQIEEYDHITPENHQ